MSHLSVRTLIEETVMRVDDSVRFGYGRASDFNSLYKKEDSRVHLDTLSSTLEYSEDSYNLTHTYSVGLACYKLDDMQGAEDETAKILDEMDVLSTKILQALNLKTTKIDQDLGINSIRKNPYIKVTVDCATGFILQFNLIVPDDFNYCEDD